MTSNVRNRNRRANARLLADRTKLEPLVGRHAYHTKGSSTSSIYADSSESAESNNFLIHFPPLPPNSIAKVKSVSSLKTPGQHSCNVSEPLLKGNIARNSVIISGQPTGEMLMQHFFNRTMSSLELNSHTVRTCPSLNDNQQMRSDLVFMRSAEEKIKVPTSLNLGHRHLTSCPVLKDEVQLDLLGLEDNLIESIQNLAYVPNLVFLDLHGNRVKSLFGLKDVPHLRVLLLGNNQITSLTHVDLLFELEVLDVHGNLIKSINPVYSIQRLRVLNLAGNLISDIGSNRKLSSLVDLNLNRNHLRGVPSTFEKSFPGLRRLFLAQNRIERIEAIDTLFTLTRLEELSLEDNPIKITPSLCETFTRKISTLTVMNGQFVNELHRNQAVAMRENISPGAVCERKHSEVGEDALMNLRMLVAEAWDSNDDLASASSTSHHEYSESHMRLNIYGPSIQALESSKFSNCRTVSIMYTKFEVIFNSLSKIVQWPHLRKLVLRYNRLTSFYQIDSFAILSSLEEMIIEDNEVCSLPCFHEYVLFRLPFLSKFNRTPLTHESRARACSRFARLRETWQNPSILKTRGFLVPPKELYRNDKSINPTFTAESVLKCFSSSKHITKHNNDQAQCVSAYMQSACECARRFDLIDKEWFPVVDRMAAELIAEKQT